MVANRYGVVTLLLIATVSSCGDNSNPVAPSAAPDREFSLKASKPVLQSPINNTETPDLTPVLETANSVPSNLPSSDFTYEFEVYEVQDDGTKPLVRNPKGVAQTPNTTSHTVTGDLEQTTTHMWRARAEVGDEKGPWSDFAMFKTPTSLGVPTPVSPIDGVTAQSTQPNFIVRNGDIPSELSESVLYDFQVDASTAFPSPSKFDATPESGGLTTAEFQGFLESDTLYYWRARAIASTSDGTVTTDWSATQSFRTPDITAGPRTPDPPPGGQLPLPNQEGLIIAVAATHPAELANSCIQEGGSWDFMEAAVTALRLTDTRWGFNCKRGFCGEISEDVVDYFYGIGDGQGSTEVYLIDIISAVCPGGSQSPSWQDQTQVTEDEGTVGRWIFPRPGE